ncbi:Bug family tripartite tricarboxylate transporter substrate binding protein [Bordetella genomosp. 12]|uniref:ABC transporter substrate-binding protein n=1 Tax=Bordetella genomosp. 12 TaxID=463035 RepID=A0A261VDS3_9BORD|nr:tripartite tricarboxylate transporter substrate binding protein [Bordetella genomosp. 12]OZI71987.1 hypothetical protein CAL22_19605 [Bordetella genomosp. 12]
MLSIRSTLAALAAAALLVPGAHAAAGFPDKPIRLFVPSPAGSAPDVMARVIGDALGRRMKQTIIVENKPGAGGIVMMNALKAAPADGYTLGFAQAAVAAVTPLTYKSANYSMTRDADIVGTVGITPMVFTASKQFAPNTLAQALDQARAHPEGVTIGSPTRSSIPDLASGLLAAKAGVKVRQIPFSGSPQGVQAVVSGQIDMYADAVAPLTGLIKGGKLKALAVAADAELPGLEGIPLAKDTVPGMVIYGWFTLHAPKGTPDGILKQLNAQLNQVLAEPEVIAQFRNLGTYPKTSTLEEAAVFLREQQALLGDVIKQMNITAE